MKLPTLILAAVLASGSAHAAITILTTREDFDANTTSQTADTFSDLAIQDYLGPITRTAGGRSYTASTGPGSNHLYGGGDNGDGFLTNDAFADPITLSAFPTGVSAIGSYFFGSNINGQSVTGQTVIITATDADGTVEYTLTGATKDSFVGFISDGDILSLSFRTNAANIWPAADNVVLAVDDPVPEAGSTMLAALGLLGLAARRRR